MPAFAVVDSATRIPARLILAERRLALACAPNGAHKSGLDHPALPLTPEDIARCAAQCREVGVSMIHLHVRTPAGRHTLATVHYRSAIEAIRRAVGNSLVIQVTSEAAGLYNASEQIAMVRELRPEAASLALREVIPDEPGERRGADFLRWAGRERIVCQYVLYDAADVLRYGELRRRGVIPAGMHWVLFVLGRNLDSIQARAEDLLPFMAAWAANSDVTSNVRWASCAFGIREIECSLAAAAFGGDVRIGFENNIYLPTGQIARDNAELLACFSSLSSQLGYVLLDADDLRATFS